MNRVLLIHTKYQNFGGEDQSVKNEIELLNQEYEVKTLIKTNNIEKPLNDIFTILFNNNLNFNRELSNTIEDFKPDIIYIHNTWYKVSLGIFKIIKKYNIPTVLKLHNFRYFCTNTFSLKKHLKGSLICQACGLSKEKYKIFNKYFNDSYIKSFFGIIYGKKFNKILNDTSLKLVVLTNFHKEFLKELGFNKEKIFVVPNYLKIKNFERNTINQNYFVYAGRISKEKGIEELIKSFTKRIDKDISLKIIGNGPLLKSLKEKYKNSNIEFLGSLSNKEVLSIINNSISVVTSTKLYEGQPTLLCEASSLSVPSIFPDTGGINEFFPKSYPLSFEQYNYDSLEEKLEIVLTDSMRSDTGKENKSFISEILEEKKILELFRNIFV
ncbi:MAG: hypothetical protein CMA12_08875 [Euryarchaeota archaeon]|nr:hypothetical protein [Euryarchaeota archaeon]